MPRAPIAPGRLVDIGTHRLHIRCSGTGEPAVVFDAALGGSSLSWTIVQPAVAEFTTACSYDRAGFGWSEGGPQPRTVSRIADELYELLTRAGVRPPYVFVGHSFGALTTRVFAARHPALIAGLVLIESRSSRRLGRIHRNRSWRGLREGRGSAATAQSLPVWVSPPLCRRSCRRAR